MKLNQEVTRIAASLLLCGLLPISVQAIVRRDDIPDSVYIDLATNVELEATGHFLASSTCSTSGATLISPQWAITAAHCTPPAGAANVSFSLGPDTQNPTLTAVPDLWFKHSSYNGNNIGAGRDFGLIHFPQPILSVTPARINRTVNELGMDATVVGYGRIGTGTSGEINSGTGTRRAATNRIDGGGTLIGATARVFVGDFDDPLNPADNTLGVAGDFTSFEGMIALFDSGGGWYVESNGTTYLAGVSSFRADADGNSNSDYGDVFGSSRTQNETTWIDTNSNPAHFWNVASGVFNATSSWDRNRIPTASDTAVVKQGLAIAVSNITLQNLFVDGTGKLLLESNITANDVLLKRGGIIAVGAGTPATRTLTGDLDQSTGTLEIALHSATTGGKLSVTGSAELGGPLEIGYGSGYFGPGVRGQVALHEILTATNLSGVFSAVDGIPIGTALTYAGPTAGGIDGLFRSLIHTTTNVTLVEYLALPGDANGDGAVNVLDFNIWNANKFGTGIRNWSTGDFNGDGVADVSDLNIWNSNRLMVVNVGLGQVPEPAAVGLLIVGALTIFSRHRRPRT